jgi:hypothetical protein
MRSEGTLDVAFISWQGLQTSVQFFLLVLKEKFYRATSFVGKESKQLLLTNIEFLNKF